MNAYEFYEKLNELYPESLSSPWDNDGIMASCGGATEIFRVLVALDATESAVNYAAENGFDVILTHHPLVFHKLGAVTPEDNVPRKIIYSLLNGVTVISLHTRLDAGEGGVNDCLADALGLSDVEAFGDDESPTLGRTGLLPQRMSARDFALFVKERLSCRAVRLSALGDETVERVAVVGGAGMDFASAAKAVGADVLVTGEAGYNDMIDSAENGLPVVEAGHYETEAVVLPHLADLAKKITGAECEIFPYTPEVMI